MLSNTCKEMLKARKGYRHEGAFGDGIRDIQAVAIYETFELENTGIPDMMMQKYSHLLSSEEFALCKLITTGEVFNFTEKEKTMLGDLVFRIAQRVTGEDAPKCIWLCASREDVANTYFNEEERTAAMEESDEWIIPENACILDDVEGDGTLFAFKF